MKIYLLFLINIFTSSNGWDLSNLNINNDYYVNSVAVHRSRAFLALPRSACLNNESDPTLIEVHWNGDVFNPFSKSIRPKMIASQTWNVCESIQDAISLEMEPIKPKLWILDKGNKKCPPKMLSYSLVFNTITESTDLTNISGNKLNVMVIDPFLEDELGHRAYIGQVEENVLLVFSLRKLVWWKISLSEPSLFSSPIRADFLTISKVTPELFITGKNDLDVFSLNLEPIRLMDEPMELKPKDTLPTFNVINRGKKLGKSSALESDYNSGIIYFMMKDYAILRWDTRFPLIAEYHNVLSQSYKLFPYISTFFTDQQDSIWALVNPTNYEECSNREIQDLETRTVRIIKYNRFTKELEVEDKNTDLMQNLKSESGIYITETKEDGVKNEKVKTIQQKEVFKIEEQNNEESDEKEKNIEKKDQAKEESDENEGDYEEEYDGEKEIIENKEFQVNNNTQTDQNLSLEKNQELHTQSNVTSDVIEKENATQIDQVTKFELKDNKNVENNSKQSSEINLEKQKESNKTKLELGVNLKQEDKLEDMDTHIITTESYLKFNQAPEGGMKESNSNAKNLKKDVNTYSKKILQSELEAEDDQESDLELMELEPEVDLSQDAEFKLQSVDGL